MVLTTNWDREELAALATAADDEEASEDAEVERERGAVEEFELGDLRRDFANDGAGEEEDREEEDGGEEAPNAAHSPVPDDEGGGDSGAEGASVEPFGDDRERFEAIIGVGRRRGLSADEMSGLQSAESPLDVERQADGLVEARALRRRVDALERRLAPVQPFDSNRAGPSQTGGDGAWIERYMAGDRSSRATSAARRAFS